MRPEKQNPDVSLLTEGVLFFGTYGAIELAWQPYYSATLLLFSKPPYHPAWTSHRNTIRRNGTRDNASCSDYAVFSYCHPGKQNTASANPDIILNPDRPCKCSEKRFCLFIFKIQTFLRHHRMTSRINLHIRSDQNAAPDHNLSVIHKSTVHIDNNMAAQENIFSIIAMKKRIDCDILSHAAQQFTENGISSLRITIIRKVIFSRQFSCVCNQIQLLLSGCFNQITLFIIHGRPFLLQKAFFFLPSS